MQGNGSVRAEKSRGGVGGKDFIREISVELCLELADVFESVCL